MLRTAGIGPLPAILGILIMLVVGAYTVQYIYAVLLQAGLVKKKPYKVKAKQVKKKQVNRNHNNYDSHYYD